MFFDDFAALLPRLLAPKALAVFTRFCELLGIRLKSAKSELGPAVTFLGLLGTYPDKEKGFVLQICLPGEQKKGLGSFRGPPIGIRRFRESSYVENKKLGRRI